MNRAIIPAFAALLAIVSPLSADDPIYEPTLGPEDRAHWAFVPPKPHPVPATMPNDPGRNPVDAFLLKHLRSKGLSFTAEADRLTLLRRITFDLTGLPPTVAEQERFLADTAPDAYERLVDRLLASPHYGERQAQHWLDVVRYADSNGYESDSDRPHAWRYRDYVIASFNADKPFHRFLTEQVAGDELATAKGEVREAYELWVAAAFHRGGPVHVVGGNTDAASARQEFLTEMANGVGSVFLGMTVGCARCHDHKFDPFSQADYYRLQAFFAGTRGKDVDLSTDAERKEFEKRLLDLMIRIRPLKDQVAALDAPYRNRLAAEKRAALESRYRDALDTPEAQRTPEQKKLAKDSGALLKVEWNEVLDALTPEDRAKRTRLRAAQHALEAQLPNPPMHVWTVGNDDEPPPTHVLKRGEVTKKIGTVVPSFPRVLQVSTDAPPKRLNRIDLAKWLTRPDHPLTARVFVNRLWQQHFGRGIVATPNDFGLRGEPPTHPELLDYLALRFIDGGWSVKDMHRLIVTSAAYRQAPSINNRRRMEGEAIRDAMLAAAGTLNRQVGGPMIRLPLEPEVYDLIFTEGEPDGLWPVTPDTAQHDRRSLYLMAKRNVRLPLMEAFDQPDRLTSCAGRDVSTFAPQALIMMNGPMAQSASRDFAALLLRESKDRAGRIDLAYRRAFGRPPRDAERTAGIAFLEAQAEAARERLLARLPVTIVEHVPEGVDIAEAAATADYALALFNTNEFIYVK